MKAAASKMTSNVTIDAYYDALPAQVRATLEKMRSTIKAAAPKSEEAVSYGIPVFKNNGPLVGLGAAKNHCAFYVMSPQVMDLFKDDLKDYDTSKGTIRFAQDKPLPANLVKKIVKARMQENETILLERKSKQKKK
ncbi:DUF1801 domain-containing protein [Chryseolinea sp. H1M3-3]|uniref:iron chaperone n=1 Tax=Chryseolinea sp. H1M3-3 TaxID=3034144 RepID=UPI0023ECF53D|nr:DUF1801 domain-containing protein [Chryseolinea sp. H1M3-3]